MASKIYKKGVFLVIEDTVSGNLKEFNTADVQIVKRNSNLDQYEVLVLGVSQLKINLADIKDESGVAYSENDWDVFRFNSVGVTSQGGSAASGVSYDGTTSGLAATDVQAAIDEVQANVDALPAAPTTVEVDIPAGVVGVSGILGMGTNPIELLPPLGAGQYYSGNIRLEYTHNTTPYTAANGLYLSIDGSNQTTIIYSLITAAGDSVIEIPLSGNNSYYDSLQADNNYSYASLVTNLSNNGVSLVHGQGVDPTNGDGTLRAIITYTVRTFGA